MASYIKTNGSIEEEQLANLETSIGTMLPDSYRQFLLQHNGGRPTPDTIDIPGLPGSPTDVQELFGVNTHKPTSDIKWNLNLYADVISHELLPIGCDSGGGIFCLVLGTNSLMGSIWYVDVGARENTTFPVAESFDSFLKALREY